MEKIGTATTPTGREVRVPLVHLNGTAAADLVEQYEDVHHQFLLLISMINLATPNARDYYPIGSDAFSLALVQKSEMLNDLNRHHETILTILESIADQQAARERRAR